MDYGRAIAHLEAYNCNKDETLTTADGNMYRNCINGRESFVPNFPIIKDLTMLKICRNLSIDVPVELEDMDHVLDAVENQSRKMIENHLVKTINGGSQ